MWYEETTQPIRHEGYPYLPSKPINDEVDQITKIRAAMPNYRRAGLQLNARKSLKTQRKVDPEPGTSSQKYNLCIMQSNSRSIQRP